MILVCVSFFSGLQGVCVPMDAIFLLGSFRHVSIVRLNSLVILIVHLYATRDRVSTFRFGDRK